VGTLLLDKGNAAEALQVFREWQKLLDKLPANVAATYDARRERASALEKMGKAYMQLGDLAQARSYYGQAMAIRAPAAAAEPDTQLYSKQDLIFSYWDLGHVNLMGGDAPAARKLYQDALALSQRCLTLDSKNIRPKADVASSHYFLATAQLETAEREAAAKSYEKCVELRKQVAAAAPTDATLQCDLAIALARCGQADQAEKIADGLRKKAEANPHLLYYIASAFALCSSATSNAGNAPASNADKAIATLQQLIGLGWKDGAILELDPDLAPVRKMPAFRAQLDQLKSRNAAQASEDSR
jgi:tetratricopeptide (TPR) repeat protein